MADISRIAPELIKGLDFFPDMDFSRGIAAIRADFARLPVPPLSAQQETVQCRARFIPGAPGDPDVRVLHYTPPGVPAGPRPVVLHLHAGGFVLGTPELSDAANRETALAHDCVVISVDYRLAPEAPWPGPVHDCHAALAWLHGEAAALGIDPQRIAVAGESAGGGHAVALALYARDQARRADSAQHPAICLLLLDAPMIDDRTSTTTDPHPHGGDFVWTRDTNRFGWGALLGMEPGGADVPAAAVPARATDLAELPPHFISVGALDLFLEENLEWSRRLTRAGVPLELHVFPQAYHAFGVVLGSPQATQLQALRRAALARAFAI